MKKIIVFYHKDCPDGFGAAWAASKKFGSRADYFGVEHDRPPTFVKNKEIYFLDFCYSLSVMQKFISQNEKVMVIDHHQTTAPKLEFLPNNFFSLDRSGSALTRLYFYPKSAMPKILRYVEDCDLWKFRLPKSRAIAAFLENQPYDFRVWDQLCKDFDIADKFTRFARDGELLLSYKKRFVDYLVANSEPIVFEGIKTLAVNSSIFRSDIGNALLEKKPPIGIVWNKQGDLISVSLRSNGKVDVAGIAQEYGGGGHRDAAGFSISFKRGTSIKLPWRVIPRTKKLN